MYFQVYKHFAFLVKFMFKYSILFEIKKIVVNKIVFLISVFYCSLLVYENTSDFCVLGNTFYPGHLTILFPIHSPLSLSLISIKTHLNMRQGCC